MDELVSTKSVAHNSDRNWVIKARVRCFSEAFFGQFSNQKLSLRTGSQMARRAFGSATSFSSSLSGLSPVLG
jgi:hypothetical protein